MTLISISFAFISRIDSWITIINRNRDKYVTLMNVSFSEISYKTTSQTEQLRLPYIKSIILLKHYGNET